MKKAFKIIIGTLVALLLIIVAIVYALSTDSVQKWLYVKGIEMLSETLETRVEIDSISVNYRRGGVSLYGFEMDDQHHVTMLKVDTLAASLELWPLLEGRVNVDEIYLHGVKAVLYKDTPKSVANYQFLIDKIKSKKPKKKRAPLKLNIHLEVFDVSRADFTWDIRSLPHKSNGNYDMNHLAVKNYCVKISGDVIGNRSKECVIRDLSGSEVNSGISISLRRGTMKTSASKKTFSALEDVRFSYQGKSVFVEAIKIAEPEDITEGYVDDVHIAFRGLSFVTDNHKPRKNVGKPHRGAFDVGHLDVLANAQIVINKAFKDTLSLTVSHLDMMDKGSGLIIKNVSCDVEKYGRDIFIKKAKIDLPNTRERFNVCHVKITEKGFWIYPTFASNHVILKDISKPFAPVLSNFTTPLNLSYVFYGDRDRIRFKDILITSPKKRLVLHAQGDMCDISKKRKWSMHFWDINMSARNGIKEQIVGHFAKKVNLKMQRQMKSLGDIRYHGKVNIFFKREDISGTLFTDYGNADFAFTLDGYTKYMTGTLDAKDFEFGKMMNIKHLGPLSAHTNYSFYTKRDKRKKGKGKLPKGTLSARIDGLRFGILSLKHISADISSDGKTATGTIVVQQKVRDIAIDFAYHQTSEEQNYTYKIRLQKISAEEKAVRRAGRKAEKAAKKARKAAEKAAKMAKADSTKHSKL